MNTKKITGRELELMLRNGLTNLRRHEDEVNRLNVFPVADGDTGTNMCMTLENGLRAAESRHEAGAWLKQLSEGMLLGARGNSGVILSQFFKGFFLELSHCGSVNPGEMRDALIRGYKTAYGAVVKPAEGTILTVTREGIELIRSQITRGITFETLLTMYIAEMRRSLGKTPELLLALKESGVVDSGAYGFILIAEGMLGVLQGETPETEELAPLPAPAGAPAVDLSLFNEYSVFEHGYCCEFILQLMESDKYNHRFRLESYIDDLQAFGGSLVVAQDNKRVKVHVHTFKPARIIAISQEYGEFLTFKLENMQLQHNEVLREAEKKPHKPLSVVGVVNGKGLAELYESMGCDCVITCEETMNASTQEFLDAFSKLDADTVVVLPNNKNVILAAEQAVAMSGAENIRILPTRSIAEGYYALAMDVPDNDDVEYRLRLMKNGLDDITTLTQTTASRDYVYREISCRAGDELALVDDEIVCVSDDWCKAIVDGLGSVEGMEDRESCVAFRGEGISEEDEEALEAAIAERWPDLEVSFLDGGQKIYHWILGIS